MEDRTEIAGDGRRRQVITGAGKRDDMLYRK
jgi:hypothetical protein